MFFCMQLLGVNENVAKSVFDTEREREGGGHWDFSSPPLSGVPPSIVSQAYIQ